MLTSILLTLIALLAVYLAYRLDILTASLQRSLQLLTPQEHSFRDVLSTAPSPPRSVVDQLGVLLTEIDNRLRNMEGAVRYLRNYAWEVQDHRDYEEVLNPKPNGDRRAFYTHEDTSTYGIWMRERDLERGFNRDIVRPWLERIAEDSDKVPGRTTHHEKDQVSGEPHDPIK